MKKCPDNAKTFSEASCCAFHYEKFVMKIQLQWKKQTNKTVILQQR